MCSTPAHYPTMKARAESTSPYSHKTAKQTQAVAEYTCTHGCNIHSGTNVLAELHERHFGEVFLKKRCSLILRSHGRELGKSKRYQTLRLECPCVRNAPDRTGPVGTVIGKPGSARPVGTPAMDLGHRNVVLN